MRTFCVSRPVGHWGQAASEADTAVPLAPAEHLQCGGVALMWALWPGYLGQGSGEVPEGNHSAEGAEHVPDCLHGSDTTIEPSPAWSQCKRKEAPAHAGE